MFFPEQFLSEINGSDAAHQLSSLRKLRKVNLFTLCSHLEIQVEPSFLKQQLIEALADHLNCSAPEVTPESLSTPERQSSLEIRKLELEAQLALQKSKHEAELLLQQRRLEAEKELQILKLQAEAERQEAQRLADKEVELEKMRLAQRESFSRSESAFLKNASLVPKFNEKDTEQFFHSFERIAEISNWPKEKWTLLLQTVWTGKAQKVYTSLSLEDARDYDTVKLAILNAYEQIPEAHRQKFRSWHKIGCQSYLEFGKDKELLFDRWVRAENCSSFEELRQLILLEEFKNCLPPAVRSYLEEKSPKSLIEATRLADQYDLTHRNKQNSTGFQKGKIRGAEGVFRDFTESPNSQVKPGAADPNSEKPPQVSEYKPQNSGSVDRKSVRQCTHCHRRGHERKECWSLFGRPSDSDKTQKKGRDKSVSLAIPKEVEKSSPVDVEMRSRFAESEKAFRSTGALGTKESEIAISVFRDTGSYQSLILKSALPSTALDTKEVVHVTGIGGTVAIPLFQVQVSTDFFTGPASVGVVQKLPFPQIHMLLGNDLAGSTVVPRDKEQEASQSNNELKSESTLAELQPEGSPSDSSNCAVTRSQAKQELDRPQAPSPSEAESEEPHAVNSPSSVNPDMRAEITDTRIERSKLVSLQQEDPELVKIADEMESRDKYTENTYFYKRNGVLMRSWRPKNATVDHAWETLHQVVLPAHYRQQVLSTAHECPLSGHLGVRKTLYAINKHFYWPRIKKDVAEFCRTCHACQMSGKPNQFPAKAPLIPIPAGSEPFAKLIVDCVGPLEKSKSGCEYLFTIMCSATRYPAAFPLRSINAKNICECLINFFSIFGLPREIQSDQGSNFMSKIFQQLTKTLGIKHTFSSAYCPTTQGALERFHATLKSMLRAYCNDHKDWQSGIPLLLFAIRSTVQESLGFSPNELIFGHEPRGPLKLIKEKFLSADEDEETSLLSYVLDFKQRLLEAGRIAQQNLREAQTKMKQQFDTSTKARSFEPGDKVLLFLPLHHNPLKAKFFGPYPVVERLNEVNYIIQTPDRRKKSQLCHINMLKAYHEREENKSESSPESPEEKPIGLCSSYMYPETNIPDTCIPKDQEVEGGASLSNSLILNDLGKPLAHLSESQSTDLRQLLSEFPEVTADNPSVTDWIEHDIELTANCRPIRQSPYRENPSKRERVKKQVNYLLDKDMIEPASSEWSSPCVIVPKSDGTDRFCVDFRKVNAISVSDTFPIPRIEDCVEKIGEAKFISKIDLLKGYHQVPLTPRAKKIATFTCSQGTFSYKVLPFGLKNAAATFQRLANLVVKDIPDCEVYIDDIAIHSDTWEEHLQKLRRLFEKLRDAKLVINLAKCDFAKPSINFLGHCVGHGQSRPIQAKVQAIAEFPPPKTRKDVKRFLGMASFYRKFCQNFAQLAAPLSNLTSTKIPFRWSDACQDAFVKLKRLLTSQPVLAVPNFEKPFRLETDASGLGMGAVLLQPNEQGEFCPVAFFSKKFDKYQSNYSTIEKEALALISSLKYFAHYVKNGDVVDVFTDHNPLTFIHKMRNDNQRLLRWSLQLQEYHIRIKHIRGVDNAIADCLSRSPDWESFSNSENPSC
jgi:transposase InsO family protein